MEHMKDYYELAYTAPENNRHMAYDLAVQLNALSDRLENYAKDILRHPEILNDPIESKVYFSLMRTFLAAQKQFHKLTATTDDQLVDALTEFNREA